MITVPCVDAATRYRKRRRRWTRAFCVVRVSRDLVRVLGKLITVFECGKQVMCTLQTGLSVIGRGLLAVLICDARASVVIFVVNRVLYYCGAARGVLVCKDRVAFVHARHLDIENARVSAVIRYLVVTCGLVLDRAVLERPAGLEVESSLFEDVRYRVGEGATECVIGVRLYRAALCREGVTVSGLVNSF